MINIYNKNKQALLETQPDLVTCLENVNIDNYDEFEVIKGINEVNVLKVRNDQGNHILYNSFYDPYKEAKEITKNIDYTVNRGLILAIGVGMGYHILEILNNLKEKSILLAIEKNIGILKNLLYHVDLSYFIKEKKIIFMIAESEVELSNGFNYLLRIMFNNILSIQTQILPIHDSNYIKYCKTVLKSLSDIKTTLLFSMGNDIDDTLVGIENRINNLAHIIENPGFNDFFNKYENVYKGKPAIIIASGPSLDKNIHLLKEAKGKALLLACDGSMDSLKKHGIIPDVVSSVERIMLTYESFYKDKEMPYDTVLAAPAVIRPEIFKTFKTKTLSLFKSEAIAQKFNEMVYDKGMTWSGACVAHQLMGLANSLGADPIILVGQDLAYSPEGVSHTSEASVKEKVDLSNVDYFVEDAEGNKIPTTFVWKQFLEIYEYGIKNLNINCIDATEGGAYIKGTKVMTLREAIDKYCTSEVPKFRDLVNSLEVDDSYVEKAYINSLKHTLKLAKRALLLHKRCEKAIRLNQRAKDLIENGIDTQEQLDEVYDALDYVEYKIIRKTLKQPYQRMLFQYPTMTAISKINKLGTDITFEVLSKNLEIQNELISTIRHYNKKLLNIWGEGFEKIKTKADSIVDSYKLKDISAPNYLTKNIN